MSDVPMPRSLTEEAVAEWLDDLLECGDIMGSAFRQTARAVRAMVREKVREAVVLAQGCLDDEGRAIVARVMGDQPKAGHDEGRPARGEAPRG